MCDDSRNMERDVERHYKKDDSFDSESFINAARGDMSAPAPFNYGHKGATVKDMLAHSLNDKGGVTLATVFAYLGESSKEDDEAHDILAKMADQFHWIAS